MNYDQPDLFLHPTAPHNGTETSRDAAESILEHVNGMCRKVYDCVAAMPGGLTCEQVEQITGMKHQTVSARIRDLTTCQPPLLIIGKDENHEVIRRPTASGRTARVYFSAECVK